MNRPLQFGLFLFPDVTQLDLTGLLLVFALTPVVVCHLIWEVLQPVRSDRALTILQLPLLHICRG
ncbi:MAG TPA: thiamine biosynthesis protein ThiJ, partial [Pantoea agglomerans]|nr:thiamine biosynthesis protein ThiJ [Pantoea agglomerans]